MKLNDWAKKTGIKYLTAYRWFKAGTLPVQAYQTDSGTIIVQDEYDGMEQPMITPQDDVMSIFLKKTVEFSKANATIEDFAAFVLTNFNLKTKNNTDTPRYSRNKPKAEDIQNHFKQFIKPKGEKPKPNMFVAPEEVLNDMVASDDLQIKLNEKTAEAISGSITGILPTTSAVVPSYTTGFIKYGDINPLDGGFGVEGRGVQNVDVTPQQINNYTSSTNSAFDTLSLNGVSAAPIASFSVDPDATFLSEDISEFRVLEPIRLGAFSPTSKEIASVKTLLEKPRRGRKSHKNIESK